MLLQETSLRNASTPNSLPQSRLKTSEREWNACRRTPLPNRTIRTSRGELHQTGHICHSLVKAAMRPTYRWQNTRNQIVIVSNGKQHGFQYRKHENPWTCFSIPHCTVPPSPSIANFKFTTHAHLQNRIGGCVYDRIICGPVQERNVWRWRYHHCVGGHLELDHEIFHPHSMHLVLWARREVARVKYAFVVQIFWKISN